MLAGFHDDRGSEIPWLGIRCWYASVDGGFMLVDNFSVVFTESHVNATLGPGILFGENGIWGILLLGHILRICGCLVCLGIDVG